MPVGSLPEHVRVSADGCLAATANADSCDLAVVDLPTLYNMPFTPFRSPKPSPQHVELVVASGERRDAAIGREVATLGSDQSMSGVGKAIGAAREYQLVVEYAEPKGIGALQLAFEQLKERLTAEGLFDPKRKRALPLFPRRIGVVTSSTGAAFRDIVQVVHKRFPNVEILLNPVAVQGPEAAGEIARAIRELNDIDGVDVLIVGRGGGSLEDLWPFNDEALARVVAACTIPLISAVGHETDTTLIDFVSDRRAPTPTAAAEMATPVLAELKATLGKALLREDATFHTFQMLDAGMRQQAALGANHPDGRLALVAATRYMVAQRLRRNVLFSTQNALKLQRGEALNEDE